MKQIILAFFACLSLINICLAEDSDSFNYNFPDTLIIPMAVSSGVQAAMRTYDGLNAMKANFQVSLPQNLPRMANLVSQTPLSSLQLPAALSPVNQVLSQDYLQKLSLNSQKLLCDNLLNTNAVVLSNQE
ncbi:MAG: hypothetical protein WC628_09620 [Candidatus Omnitrophota bacterium]